MTACGEQQREKAMCAGSVSVSASWRELRAPNVWVPARGSAAPRLPPLRLHSQSCICWELSESPPRIATSEQLAILRQVQSEVHLVLQSTSLFNATFCNKTVTSPAVYDYWHRIKPEQNFWMSLYVSHIAIAFHINSHSFRAGKGILVWQSYLWFYIFLETHNLKILMHAPLNVYCLTKSLRSTFKYVSFEALC